MSRFATIVNLSRAIGLWGAAQVLLYKLAGVEAPVWTHAQGQRLSIRPQDSDLFVAAQIFGVGEYDLGPALEAALNRLAQQWCDAGEMPVIIDAGANVGYSSLRFAQRFPRAVVIAVEPDPNTFAALVRNCAGVQQVHPVCAALWSDNRGVSLVDVSPYGSWAHQVVESGQIPSLTLGELIAQLPGARPLIVKLDIEGAEDEVCATSRDALRRTPCIMIEPHDFMIPGKGCLSALYEAVAGRRVDTLLRGENLILYDSELVRPQPPSRMRRAAELAMGAVQGGGVDRRSGSAGRPS